MGNEIRTVVLIRLSCYFINMYILFTIFFLCVNNIIGIKAESGDVYNKSCECPAEDWVDATYMDLGCILFNTTFDTNLFMDFDEAYEYCGNLGARLLEFYTQEQMDFINIILEHGNEGKYHSYWIGGSDIGHEGDWKWINSGESVPDFAWPLESGFPRESREGLKYNYMYLASSYKAGIDTFHAYQTYPLCQITV